MRLVVMVALLGGCDFILRIDAVSVSDAMPDGSEAPHSDAGFPGCLGDSFYQDCNFTANGAADYAQSMTLDTSSPEGACDKWVPAAAGELVCVFQVTSFKIEAGATVRVTGPSPWVIVSTGTIDIEGTLDVASHQVDQTIGAGTGMGSVACGSTMIDGQSSASCVPGGAGGGGAGGTGGNGGPGCSAGGGIAAPPSAPTTIRGGCTGGHGGGFPPTRGGPGGGAVYLIAATFINVGASGLIDAGGAGGDAPNVYYAAGGGGGAGGLIGLIAPLVANHGTIVVNGGGGGGGNAPNTTSGPQAGVDGSSSMIGGTGGQGASPGGAVGGNGQGMGPPGSGGSSATASGGGGGGGIGYIHVCPSSLSGGAVSSPPTVVNCP